MSSCKVAHCRHPKTHTVTGHKCGTCGKYGHGQVECGNTDKINALKKYKKDKINTPCKSYGCKFKHLHTSEGHLCHKCGRFHPIQYCPIQNFVRTQERFSDFLSDTNPVQIFGTQDNKYFITYVGMGCIIYTRKKYGSVQCFFMHSDNQGQYGPTTDDRPILNTFLEGLDEIHFQPNQQTITKKCPLCRKKIYKTIEIKGSSDKCSICLDKKVELFFPDCGHATTCKECYDKL